MMAGRDQITDDGKWHLDKKVPIALLLALAVQSSAGFWYAGQLSERINVLEKYQASSAPQADRLTRVEVKLEGVQSGINEIKSLIQRTSP